MSEQNSTTEHPDIKDFETRAAGASGAPVPEIPINVNEGRDCKQLLFTAFVSLFRTLAPAWQVTDAECEELADTWNRVAMKYIKKTRFDEEIDAAIQTTVVVAPRIALPRFAIDNEPTMQESPNDDNNQRPSVFRHG
ncbi:MAG: hypothetical protein P8Y24_14055 [Gammaproteobacteria bacterium]